MTDNKQVIAVLRREVKALEKRVRAIERVGVDHWLPRLRQKIDLLDERLERRRRRSPAR